MSTDAQVEAAARAIYLAGKPAEPDPDTYWRNFIIPARAALAAASSCAEATEDKHAGGDGEVYSVDPYERDYQLGRTMGQARIKQLRFALMQIARWMPEYITANGAQAMMEIAEGALAADEAATWNKE